MAKHPVASAAVAQQLTGEGVRLLVVPDGHLTVDEHVAVPDGLLHASLFSVRVGEFGSPLLQRADEVELIDVLERVAAGGTVIDPG